MSQVPNWFERKFDFSFPVDLFPNLCTRLRGTPAGWKKLSTHIPVSASCGNREKSGQPRGMLDTWLTSNLCGRHELTITSRELLNSQPPI